MIECIAIIEDDPDISLLIRVTLGDEKVRAFRDVEEAMAFDGWADISLALIDWMLPGKNGGDMAVWLTDHHPHVKRVCMTALAGVEGSVLPIVDETLFDLMMPKPFEMARLNEVVDTFGRC